MTGTYERRATFTLVLVLVLVLVLTSQIDHGVSVNASQSGDAVCTYAAADPRKLRRIKPKRRNIL